jgi:serine protease Do
MKKHLLPVLFCTLIFNTTGFAQLPAVVAKAEKCVFQIETFNEFGLSSSRGTGFFIDKNGTGLTAWHVLEDAKFAFIKDYSGKKYRIKKIIRSNLDADIVEFILDTKQTNFPFIPFSLSIPPKGTNVFTIGNPEGFEGVVSTGVVSRLKTEDGVHIIQTSTPISAGSSGGPLMNMLGQAIGVMSYSYSNGQNLNFAYSVLERKTMKRDSITDLMSDVNANFYMLNIK